MEPAFTKFTKSDYFKDAMGIILLFVEDRRDLVRLMLTCKVLERPAKVRFAQTFHILDFRPAPGKPVVQGPINRFLRWLIDHPDELLNSVLEFRIEVCAFPDCPETFCRCNRCADTQYLVAEALITMVNLKTLELQSNLETPLWRCVASLDHINPRPFQHLVNLFHHGSESDDHWLCDYPVKRIYASQKVASHNVRLCLDNPLGPPGGHPKLKSITHLIIYNFDIQGFVPNPFQNLQHFGTLPRSMVDGLLALVTQAPPFSTLKSIDIHGGPNEKVVTQEVCIEMAAKIMHLGKIFVHEENSHLGPVCSVWELNVVWVSRRVPRFTPWNIFCGDFDKM